MTYEEYKKRKKELEKNSSQATENASSKNTSMTYEEYKQKKELYKDSPTNNVWNFLGGTYVTDSVTGETHKHNKVNPFTSQSSVDKQREIETGHETFGTDLGQALSGGAQTWAANQLSTAATLGLAFEGLRNKDNYYQPEAGSTLWKMLQASSANTRQANALLEDSKEGRGKFGQLVMDVGSQSVTNGIDIALRAIPGVGSVLGRVSFASRSFGGSAQQARDEGKSIATQVLRGGVSAAIETATEAMWTYGGVRDYGRRQVLQDTGVLGGLTNTLEAAIAKRAGPVVGKIALAFGTEAVEEMLADVLNPVVSSAIEHFTKDSKLFNDYEAEEWQGIGNMLYDGLVGGICGIGGGIFESVGAVNTYRNDANSDNALYATILRQQYESARADAKNANAAARAVRRQSIADAVDTLFSDKTGRSVVERASEAAGRLVSRKEAFSLAGNMSEDLAGIYHDIAKNFAENNVANEVINKKVLENAVFNYLSTGEFANELNSVDDARTQIQALSKNIMAEYIADLQQKATGKHNKLKQEFYGSILSRLMNESFASEQANNQTVAEEDVEATSFRTPMEDIEADRAARAAAQNPVEDVDVPTQTFESERQPTTITAEENAQLTDEQKAQRFIASGNNVIRIEGGNRQGATTQGRQLFTAIAQETQRQGKVAELVYNEGAKEWQAIISDAPTAEQADANEDVNTESVEAEQPAALTKNDKQKINRLFSNKQKSVKIGSDAHGNLLLETIRQRAETNGVEVVIENGKVRLATKGDSNVTGEQTGTVDTGAEAEREPAGEEDTGSRGGYFADVDVDASGTDAGRRVILSDIDTEESVIKAFTEKKSITIKNGETWTLTDTDTTKASFTDAKTDDPAVKINGNRATVKNITGRLSVTDAKGDVLGTCFGGVFRTGDGKLICLVNSDINPTKVHEPSHVLFETLEQNKDKTLRKAVDAALTKERQQQIANEKFKDKLYGRLSVTGRYNELAAFLSGRQQWFTDEEVEAFYNYLLDSGNDDAVSFAKESLSYMQPLLEERGNRLNIDASRYTETQTEKKLDNKKGSFASDIDKTETVENIGSVSAEEFAEKTNVAENSKFNLNSYLVYIAYSRGQQRLSDPQMRNVGAKTYTAEIYDKNKVVCRVKASAQLSTQESTIQTLATYAQNCIGAYENGELKGSLPLSNGVGTKAQFREQLDAKFGGLSNDAYNTFKANGAKSETFQNGDFSIEMSSTCGENMTPSTKDTYNYIVRNSNGDIIAIGSWLMDSAISPAWIIAEDVHAYCVENGNRIGVNEVTNKAGEIVKRQFTRVTSQESANSSQTETTATGGEQQDDRTFDDAEEERRTMSDDEYWERRRADKDTPTVQDFERQKEQAAAAKEMSPSEAWDYAEKSFGKGHKRVTRAVRNFMKGESPFTGENADKFGAKGKQIADKFGKMVDALANVNDGYGTIQEVADMYREWRDDNSMKDYWSEEVQDRFTKMLDDADAVEWTFEPRQQAEISQAFEEAVNAMKANISNADASTTRLISLAGEAVENRFNLPKNSLVSKAVQKFIRMQISTDTAMKMFGGFKGSGQFYKLNQDIKDSVAKRMTTFIEAYNYFDDVKKMEGFAEFAADTKKYKLDSESEFLEKYNPFKGKEFTLQQILAIRRLFATLQDTVKHSEVKLGERINGFLIRDANGNSEVVHIDEETPLNRENAINAIMNACNNILLADNPAAKAAIAYSHACDEMFASLGKQVSDVRKAVTGNGISLIGDNYTPLLWANEDGSEANYTFFEDERLRPPGFLYKRTQNAGTLVVSPISYIVDKYIERASDYVGTAKMKDMLSRLNAGTSINAETKGLNATLAENFGEEAGKWFNEYVKDLTMYGQNDSIFAELRRRLQTGALIGSPSVMMKQTSSYWSAMGLLSPEALVQAYRWKVGVKAQDSTELNPLLKYRRSTNKIDPTLTDIMKDVQRYGKISNSKVFKLFTNGISEQDFKTVDNLYTATVYDTILKNRDASYLASEQFQKDVDAKFMEVMLRSQPMFDTELRAEYARTDNELVKMTSMFRTQQTQNLNLIATALGEYNASKGTAESSEKLQTLQRTLAGQATAALSLSLLTLAADVLLHGLRKYRDEDDDDKIKAEKILGRIGLNTIETISGTVWFGDYASKWLIDQLSGGDTKEFYGVNFGPVTTLQNILDSISYTIQSPTASNIKNCVTYISQAMGYPLNNAYRILNSAIIYFCDMTGQNPSNYDDVLKKWNNDVSVSDKVKEGRNLLIDYGMSKKEATSFMKGVDVDNNGLSQQEVKDYYVAHPEDADKVNILWDSMGWSQPWSKAQKSLDKKIQYNSNPLYAKMDEDESGSVSKSEAMDYYLAHKDEKADIEKAYDALGFSTSFKSAVKSAEAAEQKEIAEEAFNSGNYNVLFETVSGMKNGKSFLTNLIRDETGDEDTPSANLLFGYLTQAKLDAPTMDTAVASFAGEKLLGQYQKLRGMGLTPSDAISRIDDFDVDDNGGITQAELAEYYKAHPGDENVIAEFWAACGWKKSWADYKKSKKIA